MANVFFLAGRYILLWSVRNMYGLGATVKPVPALRVRLVRMRQNLFSSPSHALTTHEHDLTIPSSCCAWMMCVAALSLLFPTPPVTWSLSFFACAQTYDVASISQFLFLLFVACAQTHLLHLSRTYVTLLLLPACKTTCRFIHNRTHGKCSCCLPYCSVVPIYNCSIWILNSSHARSNFV